MQRVALRLLAASVVAGLLIAAVCLPLVGGVGLAAKAGADTFEALPTDLQVPQLAQRTTILAKDHSVIARFYAQDRVLVSLDQVPTVMQQALVDIEDSRFYETHGIDIKGIIRAAVTDLGSGQAAQGASTLTQQYVKNVLVQQRDTLAGKRQVMSSSISRKIREIRYALALAGKLSKKQILERYLNIVYFGDGAYGIGAAAQHYFGETVDKLTLTQAALLAGLVQNPTGYNPRLHPQAAKQRRNTVLRRMNQLGDLSDAKLQPALASPLGLHVTDRANGCTQSSAPFFCDYVVSALLNDPTLGDTPEQRRSELLRGGLTIYTTMDPKTQAAARSAARSAVPPDSEFGAGVATVQPGTGEVKAVATNRDYGTKGHATEVNYAMGGATGFQAGSTFKAFVLTAALEQGIPLTETKYAPQTITVDGYTSCGSGSAFPPYTLSNAGDSEAGTFTLTQATWLSVNTYYAQLEKETGLCKPVQVARDLGIKVADNQEVPSFFLGVIGTNPLAMASAYATFAAHGKFCKPYGIREIKDHSGKVLEHNTPACSQQVPQDVADQVTSVLRGVINGPSPARTGAGAQIGRPSAGKTGTTDSSGAAWFCGFVPQLATAVWVGDPRGAAAHPLKNVTINGRYYPQVYGGDIPASIWAATMSKALEGVPAEPLAGPPPGQVAGAHRYVAPPPPPVAPAPQNTQSGQPSTAPSQPAQQPTKPTKPSKPVKKPGPPPKH